MFKCSQCHSVFTRKDNLSRHQKTHTGIRFPCTVCHLLFSYKTTRNKNMKNVHGIAHAPAQKNIQIAPQIFVPDLPAGGSNTVSEDEICMMAMDTFENQDLAADIAVVCEAINGIIVGLFRHCTGCQTVWYI
ncbi:zinc finger protein 467-like [Myzus persicae]|uniref:zinc finger protein 467-like n=1 Tax=Myzus persicae TaxID=13164 RepID=UPI000B93432C|nr:zinc finger protein 467-like [Myzus persicae]